MNINFKEEAQVINEIISKSYGPYGQSTILISDSENYISRDGKEIIHSINSKNPYIDQVKQISASVEEYAGDGTSSAILAFNSGVIASPSVRISLDDMESSREEAYRIIENENIAINKGTVEDFVATSSGKTLNKKSIKELSHVLFQKKYVEDQYIYMSSNLYSDSSSFLSGNEMKITTEEGFSFNYHIPYSIKKSLERQVESQWIVAVSKLEVKKDDIIYLDSYLANNKRNLNGIMPDDTKLLIIAPSIHHEVADYFSKKNQASNFVYPVTIAKQTLHNASEIIEGIRNIVGVRNFVEDASRRAKILEVFSTGNDIAPYINHLIKDSGKNVPEDLGIPTILEKNLSKEEIHEAQLKIIKFLNSFIGEVHLATSVDFVSVNNDTISISGFPHQDTELVKVLKAKNKERLQKSSIMEETMLYKNIDILFSMNGTSKIMVYDSVGSRVSEIKDSLCDTVLAFNALVENEGFFVKGGCHCIKSIIDGLNSRNNDNDRLLADALKGVIYYFNINAAKSNKSIDNISDNILDSSISIQAIVDSAIKGLIYSSNTHNVTVGNYV